MLDYVIAVAMALAGFWLLVKGADWLVDGATALARLFRVSELLIGLTIVSLGTSLPELVVSVFAGLRQAGDLVLGNVIGSNIMNTLLVLGVAGLVARGGLPFARNTVLREIPLSLLAGLVLAVLANDALLAAAPWNGPEAACAANLVSRGDGLILLAFFVMFTAYVAVMARSERAAGQDLEDEAAGHLAGSTSKALLMLAGGALGLAGGGHLAVEGGVRLAVLFGVSHKLIGLLLLAAGTSLPELVTSVVAARKGRPGIAVGNVLGSNNANIFLVLGLCSVFTPLSYDPVLNWDLGLVIGSSLLLFVFMFLSEDRRRLTLTASKFRVEKPEAVAFLAIYLCYCVYVFIRA